MYYNSDEINIELRKNADKKEIFEVIQGLGKSIAYSSIYWQSINFNAQKTKLVLLEFNNQKYVSIFTGRKKYYYLEYDIAGEEWEKLKELLKKVAYFPEKKNFKKLNDYLQSFSQDKFKNF